MQRKSYTKVDLTGLKVGKYVVLKKSETGRSTWDCKCDCGNAFRLCASKIIDGKQISCGCVLEKCREGFGHSHTTHGDSYTCLYKTYRSMIDRCYNKNIRSYDGCGARGITVCSEWRNSYESFKKWAIESGYHDGADRAVQSLDRIDVNGNYEPSNCRWATAKTQQKNKRTTVKYPFQGEMLTVSEFVEKYGITKEYFAYDRVKTGHSFEEILYEWTKTLNLPGNYIKVAEYANQMGVNPVTVREWIRSGKVLGERIGRKLYVIRKD